MGRIGGLLVGTVGGVVARRKCTLWTQPWKPNIDML